MAAICIPEFYDFGLNDDLEHFQVYPVLNEEEFTHDSPTCEAIHNAIWSILFDNSEFMTKWTVLVNSNRDFRGTYLDSNWHTSCGWDLSNYSSDDIAGSYFGSSIVASITTDFCQKYQNYLGSQDFAEFIMCWVKRIIDLVNDGGQSVYYDLLGVYDMDIDSETGMVLGVDVPDMMDVDQEGDTCAM